MLLRTLYTPDGDRYPVTVTRHSFTDRVIFSVESVRRRFYVSAFFAHESGAQEVVRRLSCAVLREVTAR